MCQITWNYGRCFAFEVIFSSHFSEFQKDPATFHWNSFWFFIFKHRTRIFSNDFSKISEQQQDCQPKCQIFSNDFLFWLRQSCAQKYFALLETMKPQTRSNWKKCNWKFNLEKPSWNPFEIIFIIESFVRNSIFIMWNGWLIYFHCGIFDFRSILMEHYEFPVKCTCILLSMLIAHSLWGSCPLHSQLFVNSHQPTAYTR